MDLSESDSIPLGELTLVLKGRPRQGASKPTLDNCTCLLHFYAPFEPTGTQIIIIITHEKRTNQFFSEIPNSEEKRL